MGEVTEYACGSLPGDASVTPEESLPIARPANYGSYWRAKQDFVAWYTWMHNGRIEQHRCFQQWFSAIDRLEHVDSVLELGSAISVAYAEFFADRRYVGADLAEHLIAWCHANRVRPRHDYVACDFIEHDFAEKFDVVFSQGTIDNTYDMDGFLQAMVRASRRWIYATAYRGFFADMVEHKTLWCEEHGCFYNDISPKRVYQVLRDCGCRDIAVLPSYTGRPDIAYETLIIARVP
jgi:hypothetical protein